MTAQGFGAGGGGAARETRRRTRSRADRGACFTVSLVMASILAGSASAGALSFTSFTTANELGSNTVLNASTSEGQDGFAHVKSASDIPR